MRSSVGRRRRNRTSVRGAPDRSRTCAYPLGFPAHPDRRCGGVAEDVERERLIQGRVPYRLATRERFVLGMVSGMARPMVRSRSVFGGVRCASENRDELGAHATWPRVPPRPAGGLNRWLRRRAISWWRAEEVDHGSKHPEDHGFRDSDAASVAASTARRRGPARPRPTSPISRADDRL